MKYTAEEILEAGGIVNPREIIGTTKVRIGNIPINNPDKVINCQDAKDVEVIVGTENAAVNLPERAEPSEKVKAVLEEKGRKATERFEEKQIEKGRMSPRENAEPAADPS